MDYTKKQLEVAIAEFILKRLTRERPPAIKRPRPEGASAQLEPKFQENDEWLANILFTCEHAGELDLINDLAKHLKLDLPTN